MLDVITSKTKHSISLILILGLVLSLSIGLVHGAKPLVWHNPVTRISFGSCNFHNRNQSIYYSILEYNPDLYIWLGDAIYSDATSSVLIWRPIPASEAKKKYDSQKTNIPYLYLIERVPVVGVWDDHDYGINNGGSEFKGRDESKILYLDFIDEPKDSVRHTQPGGIYTSYDLPGNKSKNDIKLILLDIRYNKPTMIGQGDMLGEMQWIWLEKELAMSKAQIHIIGSGIQFSPDAKIVQEHWANYNESRYRLMDLLRKYRISGVIFLSGDVHYSEYLRIPARCSGLGYDLYEFTSSGLTHSCDAVFFGHCEWILSLLFTTQYHVEDSYFTGLNWGSLDINWQEKTIKFQTHDQFGRIVKFHTISLEDLQFNLHKEMNKGMHLINCDRPRRPYHDYSLNQYKWIFISILLLILVTLLYVLLLLVKIIRYVVRRQKISLETTNKGGLYKKMT